MRAPRVVLLHGLLTGSIATWYLPVALPLARRRPVILYDLRGHGASSMPASGYGLERQCEDLDAVLDAYAGPTGGCALDLVGHSLGALIALHYALRASGGRASPEQANRVAARRRRVRRLVLVELPLPGSESLRPALAALESKQALFACLDQQLGAAPGRRATRLRRRAEQLLLGTTIVADLLASFTPPEQAVAELRLPVLLVSGRRSDCTPASERMARLLPHATRLQLDCGHQIPEEAPAGLLQAIESFLDAADDPAARP